MCFPTGREEVVGFDWPIGQANCVARLLDKAGASMDLIDRALYD